MQYQLRNPVSRCKIKLHAGILARLKEEEIDGN